ncbi:MAG: hypothetical protein RIS39_576, partial [Actinomycetota bacterium]
LLGDASATHGPRTPAARRWSEHFEHLAISLLEGERNAFFDIFGFGRRLDHHRRFFFGFSTQQTVEHHHAAGQHRSDGAVALGRTTHHLGIFGQVRLGGSAVRLLAVELVTDR